MKRHVLAFLLLAQIATAQGLLDEPIKGQTASELFTALGRIYENLPKEDSTAFSDGISGLTSAVKGWRKVEMTEAERDKYVFAAVRGMTPRQVIIIGSMLRCDDYRPRRK